MPKGSLLKQKRPIGEINVNNRDSLDSGICQKPLHASRHVNIWHAKVLRDSHQPLAEYGVLCKHFNPNA